MRRLGWGLVATLGLFAAVLVLLDRTHDPHADVHKGPIIGYDVKNLGPPVSAVQVTGCPGVASMLLFDSNGRVHLMDDGDSESTVQLGDIAVYRVLVKIPCEEKQPVT